MERFPGNLYRLRLLLVKGFDRLCRIPRWRTLERILGRAAECQDDLFFVQIGANDGVIYDPIYPFVKQSGWRGVLVEPVPVYFDRLKQNYAGNDRLTFENLAISDRSEVRDFYRVREDAGFLPEWCNGLGTFDLDVLLTHKWAIPDLEQYVVKEKVQCISFNDLLSKHDIRRIDLLLMDTEGYDHEILKQIDFDRLAPGILLYEHQYIEKKHRDSWERVLQQRGYRLSRHFGNTLAFMPQHAVGN